MIVFAVFYGSPLAVVSYDNYWCLCIPNCKSVYVESELDVRVCVCVCVCVCVSDT